MLGDEPGRSSVLPGGAPRNAVYGHPGHPTVSLPRRRRPRSTSSAPSGEEDAQDGARVAPQHAREVLQQPGRAVRLEVGAALLQPPGEALGNPGGRACAGSRTASGAPSPPPPAGGQTATARDCS